MAGYRRQLPCTGVVRSYRGATVSNGAPLIPQRPFTAPQHLFQATKESDNGSRSSRTVRAGCSPSIGHLHRLPVHHLRQVITFGVMNRFENRAATRSNLPPQLATRNSPCESARCYLKFQPGLVQLCATSPNPPAVRAPTHVLW